MRPALRKFGLERACIGLRGRARRSAQRRPVTPSRTARVRQRRFWGWGFEDVTLDATEVALVEQGVRALFPGGPPPRREPPRLAELTLRPPRVEAPASLAGLCSTERGARAAHTFGKSCRDVLRAVARDFSTAPDLVAFPRSEAEIASLLAWCAAERVAVIPYGGGSSVSGGVEARVGETYRGALSLDLGALGRVLEVDLVSRAARVEAGIFGPALEDALRPRGLTLRHFPQSFECSTLGGWLATRAGGHFATLATHIDDQVESLRVVTPAGVIETRRLPASGAGPAADRWFLGSEGIFGVITEAWVRLQERPRFRASATLEFETFFEGAAAVRALAQSGLYPANCRLLDPLEALLSGAGRGRAVLFVAFESHDHPLDAWLARALECGRDHGGTVSERKARSRDAAAAVEIADGNAASGAADAWRRAFLRAPYLRDELLLRGVFVETYETAVTWERFEPLHDAVVSAARAACRAMGGEPLVTCRITHVYPDGAAPYFTVLCPQAQGAEVAQWEHLKRAITEAVLAGGGTVTHHHAVGRDARPYFEAERAPLWGAALAAAKRELDPAGIMNPGVLLPAP